MEICLLVKPPSGHPLDSPARRAAPSTRHALRQGRYKSLIVEEDSHLGALPLRTFKPCAGEHGEHRTTERLPMVELLVSVQQTKAPRFPGLLRRPGGGRRSSRHA
jgi:hypothetical protein